MTAIQAQMELISYQVLNELAQERQQEQAWLEEAVRGAMRIPVKTDGGLSND